MCIRDRHRGDRGDDDLDGLGSEGLQAHEIAIQGQAGHQVGAQQGPPLGVRAPAQGLAVDLQQGP